MQNDLLPLRVVITGHVDHGKSTILGRLLHDTENLFEGREEELKKICEKRGAGEIEWSFLLDAFQAERDQAITIDTTQVRFKTARRPYVMIDAPGHAEFVKNMMTGASQAGAAILVVDAAEGIQQQTRHHAFILSLLGLEQIAVVVNKMDRVQYEQKIFEKISGEIESCLGEAGLSTPFIVPLSARNGEMIASRGNNMGWYTGKTLVEILDIFEAKPVPIDEPLRFAVQDIYRFEGKRIIAGRVESGILKKGDELLFSPRNQKARVETIEVWPSQPGKIEARAGEAIGITLDEQVFVERGHMASHAKGAPLLSHILKARLFWMTSRKPSTGEKYKIRVGLQETDVIVQSVESDTEVFLKARKLLSLDEGDAIALFDGSEIIAAGRISVKGIPDRRPFPRPANIRPVEHLVDADARAEMNGHRGGVFWLTGLSGAGKSTLAMQTERELFTRGIRSYVLDGDNIRDGLNADLDFLPQGRTENIRRAAHVSALMADAGLVVIAAFISPYRADRKEARKAGGGEFHEIYIRADLKTCEARDPKGLYKKARSGKVRGFTGIDSPYEAPDNPDLVIDTQNLNVEDCVRRVVEFIEEKTEPADRSRKEKLFAVQ